MLNVDKYRDELIEEMKCRKENLDACENDSYRGVEIYFKSIKEVKKRHGGGSSVLYGDVVEWLFSEYDPPLLENGNELKPGDWIMVRNDDDSVIWYKNRFVCYYNATFFVVDDIENDNFNENGTNITGWKYARLPEDGE